MQQLVHSSCSVSKKYCKQFVDDVNKGIVSGLKHSNIILLKILIFVHTNCNSVGEEYRVCLTAAEQCYKLNLIIFVEIR